MSTLERVLLGGFLALAGLLIILGHMLMMALAKRSSRGEFVGGLALEGVGFVLLGLGVSILEPATVPLLVRWAVIAVLAVAGTCLAWFTVASARAQTASSGALLATYYGGLFCFGIAVALAASEVTAG